MLYRLIVPAVAVTLMTLTTEVRAAFTVSFAQVGSDVVATGLGTLNVTGLTRTDEIAMSYIIPNDNTLLLGNLNPYAYTDFYQISGSGYPSFGTGGYAAPSSGSGGRVGLLFSKSISPIADLSVPSGYVSGSSLATSNTFSNRTITDLGLTPGIYVYSFNSGVNADTFTVLVNATVPEPTSVMMVGLGLAMVCMTARRRIA